MFTKMNKPGFLLKVGENFIKILLGLNIFFVPLVFSFLTRDQINFPKEYFFYLHIFLVNNVFLVLLLISKKIKIRRTFLDLLLMVFVFVLIINYLISLNPYLSLFGYTHIFGLKLSLFLGLILNFWYLVQFNHTVNNIYQYTIILLISLSSGLLYFLLSNFFQIRLINLFSLQFVNLNILASVVLVLSSGLLAIKTKKYYRYLLFIPITISFLVLIFSGFKIGWYLSLFGLGLILILFVWRLQQKQVKNYGYLFFLLSLFLITGFLAFLGPIKKIVFVLPPEISLNNETSLDITKKVWLSSPKNLFFGSGLSTYAYDYILHKNKSFNALNDIRYLSPFNSLYIIANELGVVGLLFFLTLIILVGGSIPILIKYKYKISDLFIALRVSNFQWLINVIFVVWLILNISLFFVNFEFVLWWLWWLLLSFLVVGFGMLAMKKLSYDKVVEIYFGHPYEFLRYFVLLVLLVLNLSLSVLFFKKFLGEINYTYFEKTNKQDLVYLERANQYNPKYYLYKLALSSFYLNRVVNLTKNGAVNSDLIMANLNQAIDFGQKATELDPANKDVWENIGLIYFNACPIINDASLWAEDSFKKALKLSPNDYRLYWELANLYNYLQKQKLAIENYQKSINLKPDFWPSYFSLALIYEQKNELNKAVEIYKKIIGHAKNSAEFLFNYGRVLFNRQAEGDLDKAEKLWLEALRLEPNYANVLYSLGLLFEKKEDFQRSLSYYRRLLEIQPNNFDLQKHIKHLESFK